VSCWLDPCQQYFLHSAVMVNNAVMVNSAEPVFRALSFVLQEDLWFSWCVQALQTIASLTSPFSTASQYVQRSMIWYPQIHTHHQLWWACGVLMESRLMCPRTYSLAVLQGVWCVQEDRCFLVIINVILYSMILNLSVQKNLLSFCLFISYS
jgi:hypothetical protein